MVSRVNKHRSNLQQIASAAKEKGVEIIDLAKPHIPIKRLRKMAQKCDKLAQRAIAARNHNHEADLRKRAFNPGGFSQAYKFKQSDAVAAFKTALHVQGHKNFIKSDASFTTKIINFVIRLLDLFKNKESRNHAEVNRELKYIAHMDPFLRDGFFDLFKTTDIPLENNIENVQIVLEELEKLMQSNDSHFSFYEELQMHLENSLINALLQTDSLVDCSTLKCETRIFLAKLALPKFKTSSNQSLGDFISKHKEDQNSTFFKNTKTEPTIADIGFPNSLSNDLPRSSHTLTFNKFNTTKAIDTLDSDTNPQCFEAWSRELYTTLHNQGIPDQKIANLVHLLDQATLSEPLYEIVPILIGRFNLVSLQPTDDAPSITYQIIIDSDKTIRIRHTQYARYIPIEDASNPDASSQNALLTAYTVESSLDTSKPLIFSYREVPEDEWNSLPKFSEIRAQFE